MTGQVLHTDFLALRGGVSHEQRSALVAASAALAHIDGVIAAGAIDAVSGSDVDLVLYFVLRRLEDLEPFGTDSRYTAFLQKDLAPVIRNLSGADTLLSEDFEGSAATGVCLAIAAPEETYDWEVLSELGGWLSALRPQASAIGLAVGERQRYRGVALAFIDALSTPLPPAPLGYTAMIAAGPAATLR